MTLPERFAGLKLYAGDTPVPFVALIKNGVPDFTTNDPEKVKRAADHRLCHVCGHRLDYWIVFIGGPMSVTRRLFKDGPLHPECAEWSLANCPGLIRIARLEEDEPGVEVAVGSLSARVSPKDVELVSGRSWSPAKRGGRTYALSHHVYMHQLVVGQDGVEIDHVNRDGLDNRRSNLRVATRAQNNANSPGRVGKSRYKGVSLHVSGRWRATITIGGRQVSLGLHDIEEDAASAYDDAAWAEWGEFAWLNTPRRVGLFTTRTYRFDAASGLFRASKAKRIVWRVEEVVA